MVSTNGGMGIIDTLVGVAEENGAEMMMETRVISIIMQDGKAAGVIARQGTTEYTINAKAVFLASGGFDGQDWSQAALRGRARWAGTPSPAPTTLATASSSPVRLALSSFSRAACPRSRWWARSRAMLNDPLSVLRMINTGVYVTDLGYRCANESMTSQFDYFGPFVKTGRKQFFIICDAQQDESRLDLLEQGVELGVINKADTLEELAEAAGLPAYPLAKTIEAYNAACDAGEDAEFGKNPEDLVRVEQAPFYAVQITPNTNDSFGALAISTNAEVLDADRNPISGLYAGGTIANAELFYMRYAVSGASMCMGTRHRSHRRPAGHGLLRGVGSRRRSPCVTPECS